MTDQALVPDDTVIVLFGANGDLAKRKLLPALYHLYAEGWLPRRFRIIGDARSDLSDDEFRQLAREAVEEHGRAVDGDWEAFASNLSFVTTDFGPGEVDVLRDAVAAAEADMAEQGAATAPNRLIYLSVPPTAFASITRGLAEAKLTNHARVVYEKPFGLDLAGFHELDEVVHEALHEDQIYRIDHFLGKESVQNILALRFANGMFEGVWNRQYVESVQIDVPETLGIGTRAGFYEKTGALRDMLVTHLFQVLSVVAMEPPSRLEPGPQIDEKVKVFESMRAMTPGDVVLGQYEGYTDAEGVEADSQTDTFVAARVFVDNWRWDGVPFHLRTGKRMAQKRQTVTLTFRRPPATMFGEERGDRAGNRLTFELGGDEGVRLSFLAKAPGPSIALAEAVMEFDYDETFGSELIEAYERLLHDALLGDRTLFTRADGVGRAWEVVSEVLDRPPPVLPYPQGSWGPDAANELIAPHRWALPERP
jgi:glucose-6-phosphate 1-dehydrogenase